MSNEYEIKRLRALLYGLGVEDVDEVIANATTDDLRRIGKRYAFVNDSVSKPVKLGTQTAFDLYEYQSLVDLMFDVQLGNVSCRRAATEITNQMPPNDLANEIERLKSGLETWVYDTMKNYTDKQYGKETLRKLIEDLDSNFS